MFYFFNFFFFSSRRRHTRLQGDWSSDVCSSDLRGPHSWASSLSRRQEIRTSEYPLVYCWKCASELREDAAFCWKCGASVRGTMGVQSPTGFELLRDDKNVQNHWARRLIAYIIDVALVTVVLTIIAVVTSITFLIGIG